MKLSPDENCPSCGGTGWAVIFLDPEKRKHAVASGPCRCVGGQCWSKVPRR